MKSHGVTQRLEAYGEPPPRDLHLVAGPHPTRVPRLIWVLGAAHLLIAVLNLSPLMDSYTVATLLDVNREGTVVVWLSSATLLAIAGAAVLGGVRERLRADLRRGWWVIAAWFVILSVDETASLHERAGEIAGRVLDIDWLPGLYRWVIVVAPFALGFAVWMLRWFLRTLGWRTMSGRLVVCAIALWALVPVFEALDPTFGGPRALVVTEEFIEGLGETLMLGALTLEMAWRGGQLQPPG